MDSEVSAVLQVSAVDLTIGNRDDVVGIGTRLQAGQFGIGIPAEIFLFAIKSTRLLAMASCSVGIGGSFPCVEVEGA